MQTEHKLPKTFAFPGSTTHYLPLLPFDIKYMVLKLEPDFESKTLANCEEILQLIARREITEIELDIAEMKIDKVLYCDSIAVYKNNTNNFNELNFSTKNDKLIVRFANKLPKGKSLTLVIKYSAGYRYVNSNLVITKPRSGFHFVEYNEYHRKCSPQAWTQGETTESKYWFPCIDHPQIKFPREIEILTPANFTVISNGIEKSNSSVEIMQDDKNGLTKLARHIWKEKIPNSAYLTSVVIGIFSRKDDEYVSSKCERKIKLSYFWPLDFDQEYGMRNFQNTPKMIRYFEKFLDSPYPYDKYSQVTVEGFELGGMENTSCTTLTRNILYDKRGSLDYTSDDVISHELAHQWFGDLITCKDWPHIWLNEGFATYFEALNCEASRGKDEFQNYMVQMADSYLDEASTLYKRSIVTRVYKHPDELFDSHSYKKGGCILHMLRNYLGDDIFKKSLKSYVDNYKAKTAETDDLRKIFEYVSGKSLEQFFDQWVYGAGHPELDIEFSQDAKNIKFKITQVQDGTMFEFELEIVLVYKCSTDDGTTQEKRLHENIKISEKVTEKSLEIPFDDKGNKM
ncbi:MAG TPA: M1 family metallopeptidase, partial [Nitrososphaeraceae archaeon]